MKPVDCILLASGGLDSTVMAYWLKRQGCNVLPIFLDYGQHFKTTELDTLRKVLPEELAQQVRVINISDIYRNSHSRMIDEPNLWEDDVTSDDLYLPYRNLLFLSIAASVAQSEGLKDVYAAFINSNHAKEIDCSKEFFEKLENVFGMYGSVTIHMPFRDLSKTEVAKLGLKLGVPIALTYSCQASSTTHCGVCPNCVDRINALNALKYGDRRVL